MNNVNIISMTEGNKDYFKSFEKQNIKCFINMNKIIVINNKKVGMSDYIVYKGLDVIHLHSVEIIERYRGRGYGKAFILYLMKRYGVNNVKLYCADPLALKFYKSFDNVIIDPDPMSKGGNYIVIKNSKTPQDI